MKRRPRIAIGPELTEFGSWNWLGQGLVQALGANFEISKFQVNPPDADLIIFLKFKPSAEALQGLKKRCGRLIFMPVDVYGSSVEIDDDAASLRCFDLVVVHSRRLERYFNAAARVAYVDHPLKYVLHIPKSEFHEGPLLWIGRRCNIEPVTQWANRTEPKQELWVLTNTDQKPFSPRELGFADHIAVRLEAWTETKHLEWLSECSIAIDIKGTDFRSRHKPPAKAFDFLGSGIPVLTTPGSSVALEMQQRGLKPLFVSEVLDTARLASMEYLAKCRTAIHETATPGRVWRQFENLLLETMCS